MDCRVAPAPRNDTPPGVLPANQNTFTPDAQLTHSPRPFGENGFADGAGETAKTATLRIANGLSQQELCSESETP